MKYLLTLLALVALTTQATTREEQNRIHEELNDQRDQCDDAMDEEFYPRHKSRFESLVGCSNPAICGGVWNSYGYEVRRFPVGKKFMVWCRVENGEVTLSESDPDHPRNRMSPTPE